MKSFGEVAFLATVTGVESEHHNYKELNHGRKCPSQ